MGRYGYTGKGKKGRCAHKPLRSVYAAESYSVLKKTPKSGCGKRGLREYPGKRSIVMNPRTNGILTLKE